MGMDWGGLDLVLGLRVQVWTLMEVMQMGGFPLWVTLVVILLPPQNFRLPGDSRHNV